MAYLIYLYTLNLHYYRKEHKYIDYDLIVKNRIRHSVQCGFNWKA